MSSSASPVEEDKKVSRKAKPTYDDSEGESSEPAPPPRRRRGGRKKSSAIPDPLDSLQLGGVGDTANGLVNGATGLLGGVGGQALQGQQGGGGGGGGKSDTLRLRLDLNLDIEITLKAKIHGDLELALLET